MAIIKNIVFDLGGVLLDWNPRYLYREIFEDSEEMEFFLTHVCSPSWNEKLDEGNPFEESIILLQKQWPQYKDQILAYWRDWSKMLRGTFPDTVNLLHDLKTKGYKIYALTNWSAETLKITIPKYSFFKDFDGMVVSGEEKILKPQPRIYQILLNRYHLQANETVFIDDNPANVVGATVLGIHGIVFDNVKNVRAKLLGLNVK